MPPKARHAKSPRSEGTFSHPPTEYLDFELRDWRPDLDRIEVLVQSSPAGSMPSAATSKPANGGHPKTGQWERESGQAVVLPC